MGIRLKVLAALAVVGLSMGLTTPAEAATDVTKVGSFFEDFKTAAPVGKVDTVYKNSWQPYPDGTGGMYYSDQLISVTGGNMVVAMDGKRGVAGTFGTPSGAWDHKGGTFSIRMKATGGDGNGIAVMLWPSSDNQNDGEIDYPEGNFENSPKIFHHFLPPKDVRSQHFYDTKSSYRAFHTYTTQWEPGKYIKYYLDGKLVFTVTEDIPWTAHRYMFQIGNWGKAGKIYINWVRTT